MQIIKRKPKNPIIPSKILAIAVDKDILSDFMYI